MKDKSHLDDIDVKKANIIYHDMEGEVFERAHPEGSSIYERSKVAKSIAFTTGDLNTRDLCVDIGCGTGFVTSFELPIYATIVATDISKRMLQIVRKRFAQFDSLNLIVCDAGYLPLKSEIADLVSVSSVLHHLPEPFNSLGEISRVPKDGGFLYLTREPNSFRFGRFFSSLDGAILKRLLKLIRRPVSESEFSRLNTIDERLRSIDRSSRVDVQSSGFHVAQLAGFLRSRYFEITFAYSYHWIFPDSNKGLLQQLLTKSNFVIERIPLSERFGRYVSVLARKRAHTYKVLDQKSCMLE
jgi:ubiquinone/menaquinone biosynthesis C-methylase UbiE